MGRKKIRKAETAPISFKVEKNSVEDKWLNAQGNRTQSLKYLIQLAKHQFGNKDLVAIGLKASLDNPELNLLNVGPTTTVTKKVVSSAERPEQQKLSPNANSDLQKDTTVEEHTESVTDKDMHESNSSDINNQLNKPQTSSNKRMLHRANKDKPQKKTNSNKNYSDQLHNDDDLPPFMGLRD